MGSMPITSSRRHSTRHSSSPAKRPAGTDSTPPWTVRSNRDGAPPRKSSPAGKRELLRDAPQFEIEDRRRGLARIHLREGSSQMLTAGNGALHGMDDGQGLKVGDSSIVRIRRQRPA